MEVKLTSLLSTETEKETLSQIVVGFSFVWDIVDTSEDYTYARERKGPRSDGLICSATTGQALMTC